MQDKIYGYFMGGWFFIMGLMLTGFSFNLAILVDEPFQYIIVIPMIFAGFCLSILGLLLINDTRD